jgi:hypothetical protein
MFSWAFFDFWIAQKAEFCIIENKELYREFPQYASCGGRMTGTIIGGAGFRDGGIFAGTGGRKGWG